ncbi:MAG: sulfate adenylyltransferase subunit CysD [Candidatus Marsarchaeota archaeon]|nr:sulfate adenylyltransferase subunit CysD [Candidatus Marsarchaeota archaeon]
MAVTDASFYTQPDRAAKELFRDLEAESIEIIREAISEAENPVMLYSVGKDSSVLLELAQRAFYPAPVPFPLLHIDTTWKFREMIKFRASIAKSLGLKMITYTNVEGLASGVNPFDHGSTYTDVMKTQALKEALDLYGFDVIIGGARRDEERSRAKEKIFSIRGRGHGWNPKGQRPEFWNVFNAKISNGQTLRVFPLSNWTELDVWRYIKFRKVPIVGLYFARSRPVVERQGSLIMVDDDRMPLQPGEFIQHRMVRFRTLGCYPLTAAIESEASTLAKVIAELEATSFSERTGRLIDHDQDASMEKKKLEGYF